MQRGVNLADASDLIRCAQTLGYDWNQAHEFLQRDGVFPEAESSLSYYYLSELEADEYDYMSEDSLKVLRHFFQTEQIAEFVLSA